MVSIHVEMKNAIPLRVQIDINMNRFICYVVLVSEHDRAEIVCVTLMEEWCTKRSLMEVVSSEAKMDCMCD